MKAPGTPANEEARIAALRSLEILDTVPEEDFEDLVKVAAQIAGTPIALVSLVDETRQWFKARVGLDAPQTPRDVSFCGHVVFEGRRLVLRDAREDDRFADNPLVTGPPHVVFYSGEPLLGPTGHILGTLCVIDDKPRELDDEQVAALRSAARLAARLLARREEEREREHLASIVASTDDAVVGLTRHGTVRSWNHGAEEIYGHLADFMIGRPASILAAGDDEAAAIVERVLAGGAGERIVTRHVRADGIVFDAAVKVAPILTADSRAIGASLLVRDITARRQTEAERDRLAAVLELSPNIVAIMDPSGKPIYANRAARSFTGLDELPADWTSVHPSWARELLQNHALPAALADGTWSGETAYLDAAGDEIPTLQVLITGRDEAGRLSHIASVAHDIRERKQLEQLKDELIATVSHELRTPVTSIKGALGLLVSGVVDAGSERGRALVQIAASNAARLLGLLNDLLDAEQLASGRLLVALAPTDLEELVRAHVIAMEPYSAGKKLHFEIEADAELPRLALDARRIGQVVSNLLSNAAKFTPPGSTVHVRLLAADGGAHVSVSDEGSGVPESFRPRLFGRFAQADGSNARTQRGSGLGLHIAKGIVEGHGGEIGYDPAPKGGACFWFSLPAPTD